MLIKFFFILSFLFTNLVYSSTSFSSNAETTSHNEVSLPSGQWVSKIESVAIGYYNVIIENGNQVKIYINDNCDLDDFGRKELSTCNKGETLFFYGTASLVNETQNGMLKVYKVSDTRYALVLKNNTPVRLLRFELNFRLADIYPREYNRISHTTNLKLKSNN
ncbi:hypothetical protein [Fluviispira multicolorata]|uniref:Lipocalin-like domain-containing protein n=1 Tax=Fluviispira multicolorata TaxID=2654512 RepID=A0A833N832_9BACT|nr:hypothetical protein [Fluviispira multicolorata]KAB8033581.1 hypothetical protein GCL57_02415 [Fluviispira multicolorata]